MRPGATFDSPTCLPGLLDAGECRRLIEQIDASQQERAEIWLGQDYGVHPDSRLGSIAALAPDSEAFVQQRLWCVVPQLERRYRCEISHISGASALIYDRGDHFAAHADRGLEGDGDPPEVARRRISLVIGLNDGAGERADFSGGELQFYPGCPPGEIPRSGEVLVVRSRPGQLVAFPSPLVHRVTPVGDGRRYTLALWALAPEA